MLRSISSAASCRKGLGAVANRSCALAGKSNKMTFVIEKRFVVLSSQYHTELMNRQQKQVDKKKSDFIYDEEKDLEKEVVPAEVFDDKEHIMDDERSGMNIPMFVKFWKLYFVRYAIISTLIFGVVWIVWEITDWLSSITFKNVAKFSFYTGFLTGLISCGIGWLTVMAFSIHPATVYKAAVKKVLANQVVREQLVTPLKPGRFRAYSYTYPDFNNAHDVPLTRKMQFWKPKRMQLCFQLQDANKKTAQISCDVSRKDGWINMLRSRFTFHSLVVDIPDNEDRLFLRGSSEDALHDDEVKLK